MLLLVLTQHSVAVVDLGRFRASRRVLSFSLRPLPPERTDRDRADVASPPKQLVSVMDLLPESRRFLEAQYKSNYVVGIGIGDYQVRHFHVI